MTSRVAVAGTISSGDPVAETDINNLPGGWVERFEVVSNQGSITSGAGTGTNLTGLVATSWTVPASRRFEFKYSLAFSNTNADEQISIYLLEDGSIIQKWDKPIGPSGVANATSSVADSFFYSPSNASHTYQLAAGRSGSGSGTFTLQASSTRISQFTILDVGPA